MDRRRFLLNSSLLGAGTLLTQCEKPAKAEGSPAEEKVSFDTWADIRKQFRLAPGQIHMTQMLLASHPKPVRDAIDKHRDALDNDPVNYLETNVWTFENNVRAAAAEYMGVAADEVVLTDSTTMGLAMLFNGLKLKAGQEILTTTHDHYSMEKALEFACARSGAITKRVSLYEDSSKATADEMVSVLKKAITPKTKVISVTFVHSWTGVKTPIREIAAMVKDVNAKRSDRIYFCVDAVHGFGAENFNVGEIGCDFLSAGTHKWIFGPRGTGVFYGRKDAWDMLAPIIPPFELRPYGSWMGTPAAWMGNVDSTGFTFADMCTPGGFHSFEHRWALADAFKWQLTIGKARIEQYTHSLSTRLKEGLKSVAHVNLLTPMEESLSAGINVFTVEGQDPEETVKRLGAKKITASVTPYKKIYARLTPSLVNNESEVDQVIKTIESIKS